MLTTFDFTPFRRVLLNYVTYLLAIFVQVSIFKRFQMQASKQISKVSTSLRIWLCLILSQIASCGVIVMIIWNYNPKFYNILNVYNFYSTYVCVSAIINSKYEMYIAAVICGLALVVSQLLTKTS